MTREELFALMKGSLIVSCQATPGEPLYDPERSVMPLMARAAKQAGARMIRTSSVRDIVGIKEETGLPVIGLIKREYPGYSGRITMTMQEVDECMEALCDIVSIDCTDTPRGDGLTAPEFLKKVKEKYPNIIIMADCATLEEAEAAWKSCYQKIRSDLKSATVVSSGACSGGVKVANLGKGEDNRLEWHNVWSDTGGEYELTLYFLSAGSRNVNIVVNDDQNLWLNNCNSGTTSRVNSKKCNVLLRKGMNTICMKNDRAYMPDLDRFTLRFLRIPEGIKAATGSDVKKVEYYDLQGRKTVASHEGVTIQRTTYTDGNHDSKKRR